MLALRIAAYTALIVIPILGWALALRTRQRDLFAAGIVGIIAAAALISVALQHAAPRAVVHEGNPEPTAPDEDFE